MKKSEFVSLLVAVAGGLLFSIGMCMCLIPEWNAFGEGVAFAAVGAAVLILLATVNRVRSDRAARPVNWRLVGKIAFAVFGALVLGLGMCMILVWNLLFWGILTGAVGIVLLLCLIPMFAGLK